jgi:hypothetical protein
MEMVDPYRDHRSFDIVVTRSAGTDHAVVVFIDGDFGEEGQPPLRVVVNDSRVYGEPYRDDWPGPFVYSQDAAAAHLEVQAHHIAYESAEEV